MENIQVILFAQKDLIDQFLIYYDKKHIDVVGSAYQAAAAMQMMAKEKNAILVLDTTGIPEAAVKEMIEAAKGNHQCVVALVGDVKSGFEYLNKGAADMAVKPNVQDADGYARFVSSLCMKVKNVEKLHKAFHTRTLKFDGNAISKKIIAIGSSTGGTETVLQIIKNFPEHMPPILLVQHMPPVFTKLYAKRLDSICNLTVWEARDGDVLRPGLMLIAPGDCQMKLVRKNNQLMVDVKPGEKVNGHCPSVDVLFESVAQVAGSKGLGVILTGMGSDGANGILSMRRAGATTLGQDEASSIVYGMPKAAFDIGGVTRQVGLSDLPKTILENL